METLKILQEGHIALETRCDPVNVWDVNEMRLLEDRMRKLSRENGGIGLAANQIGIKLRLFYADCDFIDGIVVNPKVVLSHGFKKSVKEGCLSRKGMPDKKKLRHSMISVSFQTIEGIVVKKNLTGIDAIVFQHELDHLNGIPF